MSKLTEEKVLARLNHAKKNIASAISKNGQLIIGGVIIFYDYCIPHNGGVAFMTHLLSIDGVFYPVSDSVNRRISNIEDALQKFRRINSDNQDRLQKVNENTGR